MNCNIPKSSLKRVIIVGAGFAGLTLAKKLSKKHFQVVLLDKNNYHQFQPLFYQVATSGLEPSAISFPLRKSFQKKPNVHIRIGELLRVNAENKQIVTTIGNFSYDYLVISIGCDTNFFGMENIERKSVPMKSVVEALTIRNKILQNFEDAVNEEDPQKWEALKNIVIVGGGPTGVELAGSFAEMKSHVLPKDYPELDFSRMKVFLLEASPKVLNVMSEKASSKSKYYLEKLGVDVRVGTQVKDYDGSKVYLANGETISSNTVIWAAGVKANTVEGFTAETLARASRIKVDRFSQVQGYKDIYALGDVAYMTEEKFPNGHPQVAQVAIQQAKALAKNLLNSQKKKEMKPFVYKDLGSMATIGKNKAVVDLPRIKFQGFFAWVVWMFVHLMSLVGARNKISVLMSWTWSYFTYDQSLRLIFKPKRASRKAVKPNVDSSKAFEGKMLASRLDYDTSMSEAPCKDKPIDSDAPSS